MAYNVAFDRDDYVYRGFRVIKLFAGSDVEPYSLEAYIPVEDIMKRVILPQPDASSIIRHIDKFRLLAYELTHEDILRKSEKKLADLLTPDEIQSNTIGKIIPSRGA